MTNTNSDAISVSYLRDHFWNKKRIPSEFKQTACIAEAESSVATQYNALKETVMHNVVSENQTKCLIKKLKKGCSLGLDGITAEHLCMETILPLHLNLLLALCICFGRMPESLSANSFLYMY